jgi:MoaA/NifB/PqqE/SkfB family radical SAM enzyme
VIDPIKEDLTDQHLRMNLSTEEIKSIINEGCAEGIESIVLTGGEVTVRKDFEELVTYASSKGLEVIVQTNARLLAYPKRFEFLKRQPRILFIVAVHGPTAEVHDYITQVKGSFNQTVRAMNNMRTAGHAVVAKTVISEFNHTCLLQTAEFVRELQTEKLCIAFPHAPDIRRASFEKVVPRYAVLRHEVEKVADYSEATKFWIDFETIPFCICPAAPNFWRRSCDVLSKANQALPSPAANAARGFDWDVLRPTMKCKMPSCRQCPFDTLCEGPWSEYVQHFGNDEFKPISDHRILDLV